MVLLGIAMVWLKTLGIGIGDDFIGNREISFDGHNLRHAGLPEKHRKSRILHDPSVDIVDGKLQ